MNKISKKLTAKLLPKATAKAAATRGACYAGCGTSGVWRDSGARGSGERALCC